MKNICYIFFLIIFSSSGCVPTQVVNIDNEEYKLLIPPNTIRISDNFYADRTEIDVISYREFMYWMLRVYGVNSEEYQQILPDTTVWSNEEYSPQLIQSYLRHPIFDDYPIVGISLEQAKMYTNWRTDRVAEVQLINSEHIKFVPNVTKENHFTVTRYLEEDFDWILKKEHIIIPQFRIPNEEEWIFMAKGEDDFKLGIDSLSSLNQKLLKRYDQLYITNEYLDKRREKYQEDLPSPQYADLFTPTGLVRSWSLNVHHLYCTIGNVAEFVDEGVAKGGSWKDNSHTISLEKQYTEDTPNAWTGFRNICQYVKMEVSQK